MIRGYMAYTNNINVVANEAARPDCKVVFVGDTIGYENIINQFNMLVASALLPSYETMEADIEGTPEEFVYKYTNELSTNSIALQYIYTIVTALHCGRYILLFFPPESEGLKYPLALLRIIQSTTGITTADDRGTIPFQYNPAFNSMNANMMYNFNLIGPVEYLLWTNEYDIMYNKVVMDMHLPLSFNANDRYTIEWINNYRNRMIQAQKPLTKPFIVEAR